MGAYKMAVAGQPTKRTRHMDIIHFALIDWVEQDLVQLSQILTKLNTADILTKSTARVLFHRHNDVLMEKYPLISSRISNDALPLRLVCTNFLHSFGFTSV